MYAYICFLLLIYSGVRYLLTIYKIDIILQDSLIPILD